MFNYLVVFVKSMTLYPDRTLLTLLLLVQVPEILHSSKRSTFVLRRGITTSLFSLNSLYLQYVQKMYVDEIASIVSHIF